MTSIKDPLVYMGHILESIELIERYLTGYSEREFLTDGQLQDAVIRRLEIIGEATTQTPQDFKEKFPEIPWKKIANTRNLLIHEYFGVDFLLAWRIVQEDLPTLKQQIQAILDAQVSFNSQD